MLDISTSCEKLRAFERNPEPLKQLFYALETNSLTLMTMLKFFTSICAVANMAGNAMQWELQTMI